MRHTGLISLGLCMILLLSLLCTCSCGVQLNESWYAKIDNFSAVYYAPYPAFPQGGYRTWTGFCDWSEARKSTTPLIEPVLVPTTNQNGAPVNNLLYDFHAGTLSSNQTAEAHSVVFLSEYSFSHYEFDWHSNWTTSAAQHAIRLEMGGYVYGTGGDSFQSIWSTTNVIGTQGRHVVLDAPLYCAGPTFRLTVLAVPEPSTMLALLTGLTSCAGLALRKRN